MSKKLGVFVLLLILVNTTLGSACRAASQSSKSADYSSPQPVKQFPQSNGFYDKDQAKTAPREEKNSAVRQDDKQLNVLLLKAVEGGNAARVRYLLKNGANPNTTNEVRVPKDIRTVLMIAAFNGNVEIAKALIEGGAKVNVDAETEKKLQPVLMYSKNLEMLKLLIENGAKVDAKTGNGFTMLLSAASNLEYDFVSYLLEKGADPNAADDDGNTALMQVANSRQNSPNAEKIVRELLKYKAVVNVKNKAGETALSLASAWSEKENIQKLLREAGAN